MYPDPLPLPTMSPPSSTPLRPRHRPISLAHSLDCGNSLQKGLSPCLHPCLSGLPPFSQHKYPCENINGIMSLFGVIRSRSLLTHSEEEAKSSKALPDLSPLPGPTISYTSVLGSTSSLPHSLCPRYTGFHAVPNTLGIFLPEDFVIAVPSGWSPNPSGTRPHQPLVCSDGMLPSLDILPEMAVRISLPRSSFLWVVNTI